MGNEICPFLDRMRMRNLAPLILKCTPFQPSKSERLTFIISFDFEYKICSFALVIRASFLLIWVRIRRVGGGRAEPTPQHIRMHHRRCCHRQCYGIQMFAPERLRVGRRARSKAGYWILYDRCQSRSPSGPPLKECRLKRHAQAGAVPGRGAVIARRMPPADWRAASTVGPPGAARN